jgi:hypothetical protein
VGVYSVMNHCVGCIFVLMNVGVYSVMNRCVGCIFILMNVLFCHESLCGMYFRLNMWAFFFVINRCVGWIFILNDCGCSKFCMRSYVRGGVYVYSGISYRGIFITVAFALYSGIFFVYWTC